VSWLGATRMSRWICPHRWHGRGHPHGAAARRRPPGPRPPARRREPTASSPIACWAARTGCAWLSVKGTGPLADWHDGSAPGRSARPVRRGCHSRRRGRDGARPIRSRRQWRRFSRQSSRFSRGSGCALAARKIQHGISIDRYRSNRERRVTGDALSAAPRRLSRPISVLRFRSSCGSPASSASRSRARQVLTASVAAPRAVRSSSSNFREWRALGSSGAEHVEADFEAAPTGRSTTANAHRFSAKGRIEGILIPRGWRCRRARPHIDWSLAGITAAGHSVDLTSFGRWPGATSRSGRLTEPVKSRPPGRSSLISPVLRLAGTRSPLTSSRKRQEGAAGSS